MAKKKIPIILLDQLVRKGRTVSQIAEELKVTKGAVSKALKRLSVALTKDVVLRSAPKIVDRQIDAMGQLKKINDLINKELDYIESNIQTATGADRKDFQKQRLEHVAEIRKQVDLLLDIAKTLYDTEEVAAFQQIILEEIGRAAPEVQDRIVSRLNERRAIRSSFEFRQSTIRKDQ
jgi:predicted transcriptional regulator